MSASEESEAQPAEMSPELDVIDVTIVTAVDYRQDDGGDFVPDAGFGTFEVTVGADALGCSGGTFEDSPVPFGVLVRKTLICEAGPKTGTLTVTFDQFNSAWRDVFEATGDFIGIQGSGSWELDLNETERVGVETLIGELELAQ